MSHSFVCHFDFSQSGVDESACVHGLWTQCLQGLFGEDGIQKPTRKWEMSPLSRNYNPPQNEHEPGSKGHDCQNSCTLY